MRESGVEWRLSPLDRPTRDADCWASDEGDHATLHLPGDLGTVALHPVEATVWEAFDGSTTVQEVVDDLVAVLGGEPANHFAQVAELVNRLAGMRALQVRADPDDAARVAAAAEAWGADRPDLRYDFILEAYEPLPEGDDPLESIELLRASFPPGSAQLAAWDRFVPRIQDAAGVGNTVWAVKLADGALRWELYFRARPSRLGAVLDGVRAACEEVGRWEGPTEVSALATSFSFEPDFDATGALAPVTEIDIYIPSKTVRPDVTASHVLTATEQRLKNVYFVYPYPDSLDLIRRRLRESRYHRRGDVEPYDGYLAEHVADIDGCHTVWVADKPAHDGLYFQGILTTTLVRFLDRYGFPEPIRTYARDHAKSFAHLRHDVGLDFTVVDGRAEIRKAAHYGIF
jgi:hypothetical protein